jgi:TP901 family phage tail tape measure protein
MSGAAAGIRAGQAFVEIKAHDTEFQRAMGRIQEKLANVGSSMRKLGTQFGMAAGALGAPMVAALAQARGFDDAMREIQASVSDLSPAQLKAISDESLRLGKSLGAAPSKFATAMLALVKAGMPLEAALHGGAEAAVHFAEVGKMEVVQAAELMSDAMNVFGADAKRAGFAISSAADASSTDIQGMSQAFSQVGAVAGMANQSIEDTSAALGILAAGMMKGSDAGTSLKTMLLRLMTPSGETAMAMGRLGLNTRSFVDAAGKPLPLPKIIGVLNEKLSKLDEVARRDALGKLFGSDAIRAAQILTKAGTQGFDQMRESMDKTMPLAEKYKTLLGGTTGLMSSMETSAELVSIAFTKSLGPALRIAGDALVWVSSGIAGVLDSVPGLGPLIAGVGTAAGTAASGLFLAAGATTALKWAVSALSLGKAADGVAKLAPVATKVGPVVVRAMGAAAWAIRGVVTAVTALGAGIASLGAAPLIAIASAAALIGGAIWWMSSTPSGNKKGKGKGKGGQGEAPPDAAQNRAVGMGITPEAFQAGMTPAAMTFATNSQRPLMSSGDESALSLKGLERRLDTLIDVVKQQRPAFA